VSKVAPAGKKLLYRLSSLMLWLVNERRNADGAPAALVLKERLGHLAPTEEGTWEIKRMLPQRIPHCTWADVSRYLEEGCDLANPAEGEAMSAEEQEMISDLLSDKQMRLMVLAAERDLEELRQETAPIVSSGGGFSVGDDGDEDKVGPGVPQMKVLALLNQGANEKEIAKELGKPLPLVKRWIEEVEDEQ
jgi:hypothetical protein